MRFASVVLSGLLAALAAADSWLIVSVNCTPRCKSTGSWYSAFGRYEFDANDGCRNNPTVPGVLWVCIDWPRTRASFQFRDQGQRCMRQTAQLSSSTTWWDEVPCSWRTANPANETAPASEAELSGTTETA